MLLPGCGLLVLAWAAAFVHADALAYLERGAKLECTYRPAIKTGFNASDTACLQYFRSFMTTTGMTIAVTWRTNGVLDATGTNYLWVSKAGYMYLAFTNGDVIAGAAATNDWNEWVRAVVATGTNLLKKGYQQQPFVTNELALLRDYRMFTEMKLTQAKVLPHEIGLTMGPASGAAAPDARLFHLECVLTNELFNNAYATLQTEFVRPEGLGKFSNVFAQFITNAAGSVVPRAPAGGSSNGWLQLSDRPARPILLMANKPSDVFQRYCNPLIEPVLQAYKHFVDIYFVATSYHDTFSTHAEYYGGDAGANVRVPFPTSRDDHARDARHALMVAPHVSVPFVLDNAGHSLRDAYGFTGGNGPFFLIDVNGMLAYQAPLSNAEGATAFDQVIWVRDIEYQLKLLVDNGGTSVVQTLPDPVRQEQINKPANKKFVYSRRSDYDTVLCGEIIAVYPASNMVVVQRRPVNTNVLTGFQSFLAGEATRWGAALHGCTVITNWLAKDGGARLYTFVCVSNDAVAGLTNLDVFVDGLRAGMGSLASGSCVGVKYDARHDDLPVITAEHLRVLHAPAPPFSCSFTADVTHVMAHEPVQFAASVPGADPLQLVYRWDFEHDGVINTQGMLPVLRHSYLTAGVYSISLSVSNFTSGAVATSVRERYVTVVPEAPWMCVAMWWWHMLRRIA